VKAYRYIAYTTGGRRRSGTVVAETEADASRQLSAQDLFVAELSQTRGKPGSNKPNANPSSPSPFCKPATPLNLPCETDL
jgi:general secretion pathway protein F